GRKPRARPASQVEHGDGRKPGSMAPLAKHWVRRRVARWASLCAAAAALAVGGCGGGGASSTSVAASAGKGHLVVSNGDDSVVTCNVLGDGSIDTCRLVQVESLDAPGSIEVVSGRAYLTDLADHGVLVCTVDDRGG